MMQEPNATLATWLRTTRTEAGLTQVLLAEKAGIESRTIIKSRAGKEPNFFNAIPNDTCASQISGYPVFPEQHLHSPEKNALPL